jgi:hypothetical protein
MCPKNAAFRYYSYVAVMDAMAPGLYGARPVAAGRLQPAAPDIVD